MPTWDIYDGFGNWLGTAAGLTEAEAIENARLQGMPEAANAKLCRD